MTRAGNASVLIPVLAGGLLITTAASGQQFQNQTAARFPASTGEYTNQLSIGDIDGDIDLDIVFANGGNFNTAGAPQQLRVYVNNGTGTFTDESLVRAAGALFLARGVEMGDVDGDTDLDLIVAQDFNLQPQLLINNGAGVFANQTVTRLPVMLLSSSRGQFADVDNDGDLDIYLVNGGATSRFGTGPSKLLLNNGAGVFTDASATNLPAGNIAEPMDCIFGDIDGDFDMDLRVASRAGAGDQSRTFKNSGTGVFTQVASPADNNTYSYDFGDIDADGDLDLLGANASASVGNAELLLRNSGTGSFTSVTFPSNTIDDNDSKFIDYDMDGDLDIIVCAIGGIERAYTNNGTGTYVLATANTIVPNTPTDSSMDIKVADLTGDGRIDIVTGQGESGAPYVNKIYVNTGAIDNRVPRIVRTEQLPDTDVPAGPYWVRAIVYDDHTSDRGFHDRGVFLNYSVNAGPTLQVPMKWYGNSGWRGAIPGQPAGSQVSYFVTALDFNNNLGTGSSRNFQVVSPPCPADITNNGVVNVEDLLAVISAWGQSNVTHNVAVSDFVFAPDIINAKSGDTMQWNWVNGTHTVTSGGNCTPDGLFNSSITSGMPTLTYVIPFDLSGAIPYYCIPHCSEPMLGTINVVPFPADVNQSGVVNVEDLLAVIGAWGPCP